MCTNTLSNDIICFYFISRQSQFHIKLNKVVTNRQAWETELNLNNNNKNNERRLMRKRTNQLLPSIFFFFFE